MCSPDYSGDVVSDDQVGQITSQSHFSVEQPAEIELPPDFPGFPTYAQYTALETAHLARLSTPSRQEKALMPQSLFDRIWDVLVVPDTLTESPQFRFWVRKTFSLGPPPASDEHAGGSEVALLQKGLLVAVREQLYQILCHFHGQTDHGGRDKTAQVIHQHYRYVPKRLVQEFVKACPTCIRKNRKHPHIEFTHWPSTSSNKENRSPSSSSPPHYHTLASSWSNDKEKHPLLELLDVVHHSTSDPFLSNSSIPASPTAPYYASSPPGFQTDYRTTIAARRDRVLTVSEFLVNSSAPSSPCSEPSPLSIPKQETPVHSSSSSSISIASQGPESPRSVLPTSMSYFASNPVYHSSSSSPMSASSPAWEDFFLLDDSDDSSSSGGLDLSPPSPSRNIYRAHPYKVGGDYYGRARYRVGTGAALSDSQSP